MCLNISKDSVAKAIKRKKNNKKIYAYKVVLKDGSRYFSPYVYALCSNGLNRSNRKRSIITKLELNRQYITKGFHCYLRLKDAIQCEKTHINKGIPFRVEIDPIDLVAYGRFVSPKTDSLVCTKYKIDLDKPCKCPWNFLV